MFNEKVPTAEKFQEAFMSLESKMTETRHSLLREHYQFPDHTATMTQIATKMGWNKYVSGNTHYGKLARLVSEQIGFHPDGCFLGTLCTFIEPKEKGEQWLIIMRPQVVKALENLGWI